MNPIIRQYRGAFIGLGALLLSAASSAHAEDGLGDSPASSGSGSVTGIFDGLVVGSTTKHSFGSHRPSRGSQTADSFAVASPEIGSSGLPSRKPSQAQQLIVPSYDTPANDLPPPEQQEVSSNTANPAPPASPPASNPAAAVNPSENYFRNLIGQVKRPPGSENVPSASGPKYMITDANRF